MTRLHRSSLRRLAICGLIGVGIVGGLASSAQARGARLGYCDSGNCTVPLKLDRHGQAKRVVSVHYLVAEERCQRIPRPVFDIEGHILLGYRCH